MIDIVQIQLCGHWLLRPAFLERWVATPGGRVPGRLPLEGFLDVHTSNRHFTSNYVIEAWTCRFWEYENASSTLCKHDSSHLYAPLLSFLLTSSSFISSSAENMDWKEANKLTPPNFDIGTYGREFVRGAGCVPTPCIQDDQQTHWPRERQVSVQWPADPLPSWASSSVSAML